MSTPPAAARNRGKGFARTSALLSGRIREASATRGFAQAQLLTRWEEIAGPDLAQLARPVEVTYGRGSLGATLVLLTTGGRAPELEMRKAELLARVNACYGYAAIARIRVTQTAPTGFAEGQVAFESAPAAADRTPSPDARAAADRAVAPVSDDGLRAALARLGANVMSRTNR